MNNTDRIIATDLYLKYTDKDGHVTVLHHRVWDSALFFQTRSDEAATARSKGDKLVKVELSDVNEWKKSRRP